MPGVEGGEDRADWRALKETGEAASLGRHDAARSLGRQVAREPAADLICCFTQSDYGKNINPAT